MVSLSPGVAIGCFEILLILSREPIHIAELRQSFSKIASVNIDSVLRTLEFIKWIDTAPDGKAIPTGRGNTVIQWDSYERRLRELLKDYLAVMKPAWLQSVPYGRSRVLRFLSPALYQLFYEAGLADGLSPEIIEFWDCLAIAARGELQIKFSDIGRWGERNTLLYEEKRTGRMPKWVSVEDNSDGYDVLSVVGDGDLDLLSIEVKATTTGRSGEFHVTKNEWGRAFSTKNYVFHLWRVVSGLDTQLAIVSSEELIQHMPFEQGAGRWETVVIPFSQFESRFLSVTL